MEKTIFLHKILDRKSEILYNIYNSLGFYYLGSRYYDANIGRFISPDAIDVVNATPIALTDKNLYAYCDNNPIMRVDNGGEFWLQIGIGALIGFEGGIIDQAVKGDWSTEAWIKTGISTIEGAITAVVGPIAGAVVSGTAGAIESAISGSNSEEIIGDAIISASISLLGSGAQLAAGRALAGEFVDQASKTQLKTFANSLGYNGRNFKSASSWSGRIMYDSTLKFMNTNIAQVLGKSVSFFATRARNVLFS